MLHNLTRRLATASVLGGWLFIIGGTARCQQTIYQWFPADKTEAEKQTAWKIRWEIENPKAKGYSSILHIKEVSFMRKPALGAQPEDWFPILKDAHLAEIFVPYDSNEKKRVYDISGEEFIFVKARPEEEGPACITPPKILGDHVIQEVHDDGVRWKERLNKSEDRVYRGQIMLLWATLQADNYRYIIQYGFRDDGVLTFRVGATGHNSEEYEPKGAVVHTHVGCWRIEMDLGDPDGNQVKVVERRGEKHGHNKVVVRDFNEGMEGGEVWDPERYTMLRVISTKMNGHTHPHPVSYDLMPLRWGTARYYANGNKEKFTLNDFWVTVADPEKVKYVDVAKYAEEGKLLAGKPVVLWHASPVLHIPRDEDWGQKGTNPSKGVALTMWGGFELRPRNLFEKTPFYPR